MMGLNRVTSNRWPSNMVMISQSLLAAHLGSRDLVVQRSYDGVGSRWENDVSIIA